MHELSLLASTVFVAFCNCSPENVFFPTVYIAYYIKPRAQVNKLVRCLYSLSPLYTPNFIRLEPSLALLAFVSVFDQSLIEVLLADMFQDVEETQVDSVRLFHDEVQQRLGGFDWTTSQRLN